MKAEYKSVPYKGTFRDVVIYQDYYWVKGEPWLGTLEVTKDGSFIAILDTLMWHHLLEYTVESLLELPLVEGTTWVWDSVESNYVPYEV